MRILGLDYGEKTVGVAVCDETETIATGLEIIRRDKEESIKKSVSRIKELITEYNVQKIVLGYPKNLDGSEGFRCEKTVDFKERLHRNFKKMDIELFDERFSTVSVTKVFQEARMKKEEQKEVVDKMAAVLILQNYLDTKNKGN